MNTEKPTRMRTQDRRALGILVILALGIGAGALTGLPAVLSDRLLLAEAERAVYENALGPLPEDLVLERGMIEGMLHALGDPYAAFLPPSQHELETQSLSGQFGGIGASLARTQDGRHYLIPLLDGPAAAGGFETGDILIRVDQLMIDAGTNPETVLAQLRGEVGTAVRIQVERNTPGSESYVATIIREQYELPSIVSYQSPDAPLVGVLHLSAFTGRTESELHTHFNVLLDAGVQFAVLDLRGNSGGLLDAALAVADFFLAEGIIYFEVRQQTELAASAHPGQPGETIPLAVVIDGTTISAAEVVAGSLQSNGRATLFGSPTFGKGSVQTVLELSDGSSIHVTTATWLTPDRKQIEAQGIRPDFVFYETQSALPDASALAISHLLALQRQSTDGK